MRNNWQARVSEDEAHRRAAGRQIYNAVRQFRARVRRQEVLRVLGVASPYIAALAAALRRYVSAAAAARILALKALSDTEIGRSFVIEAGFRTVDIRTVTWLIRRMDPPDLWIPQAISATAYAETVAALDTAMQDALVQAISAALQAYGEGDGFAIPTETHLVIAQPSKDGRGVGREGVRRCASSTARRP